MSGLGLFIALAIVLLGMLFAGWRDIRHQERLAAKHRHPAGRDLNNGR